MTLDGVLAASFVALVFLSVGILLARYHYLEVIAGQQAAIEALEDYIEARSEIDTEANAEDLWGHG